METKAGLVHQINVKIFRLFMIMLCFAGMVLAESEPIELLSAATMQRITEENPDGTLNPENKYLMFDKDVHLKQGNVHLFADRIYQFEDIDLLRLFGHVRIFDDSVTVTFESGEYNTETKDLNVPTFLNILYDSREFSAGSLTGNLDNDIYLAKGDVEIKDSISYAFADSLRFDRENERAFLYGRAVMSDTVNHMTMRGAELEYRLDTDEFFGHKDASVYETLDDGTKRFEVFAKKLQGNINEAWLIARDSVYVQQDSSSAWCDSLFYNDTLQTVGFYGDAHVRYKQIDMYGPEMHLDFYRQHLGQLTALKDPRVTLSEEGFIGENKDTLIEKISNMTGKRLHLEFNTQDEPEWMDMIGMVTSDYHVFKDSVYKGMNHMTSDTIHIMFNEGDVSDLFAIFGVEGRFDPDTSYKEMDTSVFYYGNEAHYSILNDNMFIYPSTNMNYGDIKLKADTMKIDWNTNILYAMPGKSGDLPEFIQGDNDPVYGRLFEYNLDTQRGRITRGKTTIKDGYYQGNTVLKTEDEPLYVANGVFSTCELEHPHFCVEAKHMKVIPGDRVFAQDLTLKVMDIPLLYIPSLFVSIEEGKRRSGWIVPGFQQSASYGWGLKGSGYYWAPNDYYDARILVDFYDSRGIDVELRQRYAWRDHISGGYLTLKYWNNFLASTPRQGYKISISHPQRIGQNTSLNINVNYTNDASRVSEELDPEDRLEQQMYSSANFQTKLGAFSVGASGSHKEDLLTGNTITNFPQFTISKSSANLIKRKNDNVTERWYHKITYNINSTIKNQMTHTWNATDSLFNDNKENMWQTNAGVKYNDKLFGFLTATPFLNYSEDWTMLYEAPVMRNDSALVDTNGNLVLQEINGFKRRGRFDMGAQVSTKLYGVFNMNIWRLKAIRHAMNVNLKYVYKPDQSGNPDYVFNGIGTDSTMQTYDYFSGTMLGKTPNSESQTFTLGFTHNFDSKILNKDGKEKKTNFLTLSHNYNFLADSLRSSVITAVSTISDLPGGMNLKINATFDPYAYRIDETGEDIYRINQLTIPRMTSFQVGTGLVIKPKSKEKDPAAPSDSTGVPEIPKIQGADTGFSQWSISSTISYNLMASNPLNINNTLAIRTTMKAQLTPKWSGTYLINFDVLEQKITSQQLKLSRDLHCWTLSIDWYPGKSFFISLNAKSDLLSDFKLLQKKVTY